MADFTTPSGGQLTIVQSQNILTTANVAKSVRFPNAPRAFTVYFFGTNVALDVYAVTPGGDVLLGSGAAGSKFKTFTDVAGEVKVKLTNNDAATQAASAYIVSSK